MITLLLSLFAEVWFVDFEFRQPDGDIPEPVCMVARERKSGRLLRLWQDDLSKLSGPPWASGPNVLFVAYYASAEFGCYLSLGWPMPQRIVDLYAEFRCKTSGLKVPCGHGLLGALTYHGLDGIEGAEKESMRQLAMRGGPYSPEEREALLDYCQSDVDALAKLFDAMLPSIDVPRALLRGRYMAAAARIERTGTPIDVDICAMLEKHWDEIKLRLIDKVDKDYGVLEGRTFKRDLFSGYLIRKDIPWPHLDSGVLALDDNTFKMMAKSYPQLCALHELRRTLSGLRLGTLPVGKDGRNRCLLSAFRAKTSRNAPSTTKFVFGLPAWLRALIKPEPGKALAYVDWSQQEFGIAGALSGDEAMMEAYASGDPYLTFAKQAKAVPADATKQSHPEERGLFKVCALAVQYGMSACSLATQIKRQPVHARRLLELHRETYPVFWAWNDAAVDHAMLCGGLHTVFGWKVNVGPNANPRSLMNFPMQANGAEMLRLACCLATERGIAVCAPVHDALLIEADLDDIEAAVAQTQQCMLEVSRIVLNGFELRSDVKIVKYPDRYMDERGGDMWAAVMGILEDIGHESEN